MPFSLNKSTQICALCLYLNICIHIDINIYDNVKWNIISHISFDAHPADDAAAPPKAGAAVRPRLAPRRAAAQAPMPAAPSPRCCPCYHGIALLSCSQHLPLPADTAIGFGSGQDPNIPAAAGRLIPGCLRVRLATRCLAANMWACSVGACLNGSPSRDGKNRKQHGAVRLFCCSTSGCSDCTIRLQSSHVNDKIIAISNMRHAPPELRVHTWACCGRY